MSLAINFAAKTFNCLLDPGTAFESDCQMASRGLNLDSNWDSAIVTLPPDQRVVKVLSAPKPLNKVCSLNSFQVS